jgi:zinc transport system substrate-binding protein
MRATNPFSIASAAALLLSASLLMPACKGGDEGGDEEVTEAKRLSVYTSCFPVDWLTRRVAGEHVDVTHILPIGEDPPEWTPPAEIVTAMQGADLIVVNGASFEGWIATVTLPDGTLVDSTAGLKDRLIHIEGETHSHGKGGAHTHAGTDPHTWSDPTVALAQADAIRAALAKADPSHADAYQANLDALKGDLEKLDTDYKAALAGYDAEVLPTSHPAFNYLGARYGLTLDNYGFEPDEQPDAEQFAHFADHVGERGYKRMLWESMPLDMIIPKFTATGVEIVFLDPLEQPPTGKPYDYLAQANANVITLRGMFPVAEEAATKPAE